MLAYKTENDKTTKLCEHENEMRSPCKYRRESQKPTRYWNTRRKIYIRQPELHLNRTFGKWVKRETGTPGLPET